jgi:glycosyltransferase involved in cell wall biosynthesis
MHFPKVTVIVPGRNASSTLRMCLRSLRTQDYPQESIEILFVDDASTDNSAEVASSLADRVIALAAPRNGPAAARNAGAQQASGDILAFIDADVVAPPGTIRALAAALARNKALSAVFGSYDAEPMDSALVSQYRNLLHHFVHQTSRQEASTFWAGCGAIWKRSFEDAGRFDAVRYKDAMIEDIELGHRMRAMGMQIQLEPSIQVKHLKRWTLFQIVRSDIFYRGIPWMRLLFQDSQKSGEIGDLNLKLSGALSIAISWLGVFLIVLSLLYPRALYLVFAAAIIGFMINIRTFRFFWKVRGPWFALKVIPLHALYHLYNGASVVAGLFCHLLIDRQQRLLRRFRLR